MKSFTRFLCFSVAVLFALNVDGRAAQGQARGNLLPKAAGSGPIGRVTFHWIDSSRTESFSVDPAARRELLVDVWYPAHEVPGGGSAPYLPDLAALRLVFSESGLRQRFAPAYAAIELGSLATHAVDRAPAGCPSRGCPLLVFSHGSGVDRSFYTAQFQDLAAHGYVVAVIAHPYISHVVLLPDKRVVRMAPRVRDTLFGNGRAPIWRREFADDLAYVDRIAGVVAADIRFVIDRFSRYERSASADVPFGGQVDLERIGAFGHSIGGRGAAVACQTDPRIKACLNQDGSAGWLPFSRDAAGRTMAQPFLYFTVRFVPPGPAPDSVLAAIEMTRAEQDSLTRALPLRQDSMLAEMPGGAWRVRLMTSTANHMSFSDDPLIRAGWDSVRRAAAIEDLGMIQRYTRAFFDKVLSGQSNTALERPVGEDSSRVSIERFAPAAKPGGGPPPAAE
jgi:hypothetical protein